MGFVAYHTGGYEWIFWIFAIINGLQFILYFFLSPETLYVRNAPQGKLDERSAFRREYLNFGKIGPFPLTAASFWTPFTLFAYPNILLPTVSYAVVFNFTSVLLTVEIPQVRLPSKALLDASSHALTLHSYLDASRFLGTPSHPVTPQVIP